MENKINIAEILKDCPKGMELDCTMFDNVTFVGVNIQREFPIEIKVGGIIMYLTKEGCYHRLDYRPNAKCVIFPKGKTTWEGFHRPFKDGDVLSYQCQGYKNRTIYIYMQHNKMNTTFYVALSGYSDSEFIINQKKEYGYALSGYNDTACLASDEEKQKLFQAIKDNGYHWNSETKTLEKLIKPKFKVGDRVQNKNTNMIGTINLIINDEREYQVALKNGGITYILFEFQDNWELVPNKFDISTLKPFDKVLVRDNDTQEWSISLFSHYNGLKNYKYSCINGNGYAQCIPYKGNEHLLGTSDDCNEYFKTWE